MSHVPASGLARRVQTISASALLLALAVPAFAQPSTEQPTAETDVTPGQEFANDTHASTQAAPNQEAQDPTQNQEAQNPAQDQEAQTASSQDNSTSNPDQAPILLEDLTEEELRELGITVTTDENFEYDWDNAEDFDVDWDEYTLDRVVFIDPPANFSRFDLERARAEDTVAAEQARERGARTLDEAITALTPFQPLPSTGASPGPLLVDGLDGAWVQVLIDGIPFTRTTTTRTGPIADLGAVNIDPARIERIDIYRGGNPAGSCGSSGLVLNLITKTPDRNFSGSVSLDGGVSAGGVSRYGTRADLSIPIAEDWTLRLNGGFQRTLEVEVTGDNTYDRPRRDLGDADVQALWRPNGEDRLTINARTHHQLMRTIGNPNAELEDRTRSRNYALDVQYRNSSENDDRFTLRTSVQYLQHQFFKHVRRSGFDNLRGNTDAVTTRATGTWNREFGNHALGVEICTTADFIKRDGASGETPSIQEGQFCVGLHDVWRISDVFTLEAQVLGGYHTKLGPRWNAGIAGVARINDAHGLRLSFDAAQRLPTVEERYLQFDHSELGYYLEGNPDLESEQAFSLRTGWVYDVIPNMLGLEITGFYTNLRNRIEGIVVHAQAPPEYPVAIFGYENRGRGVSAGIDTVLRGSNINDWFGFDLSYNFLPIARDPDTGGNLHNRSHHATRLSLRGSFLNQRLNVWTSAGVRSRILWTDGDPAGPPAHPTLLWDAGISGVPHENVWLNLTARNLTNYVDPTWGPMPGFEVLFSAQFHFEGKERQ